MTTTTGWMLGVTEQDALRNFADGEPFTSKQDALEAVPEASLDVGAALKVYKITVTAEEDAQS